MKIKTILCTILVSLSLLAFSGISAYADAIAEPGNPFYGENFKECTYINLRPFEVLEDSVMLASPLENKVWDSISRGETVRVCVTYTDADGVEWGCCSFFDDDRRDGWVEMSKLSEIYNVFTFLDEHNDEIREYSGESEYFSPEGDVILWEYPFGSSYRYVEGKLIEKFYSEENYYNVPDKCWTDNNGNTWLYFRRFIWDSDRCDYCWIFLPAPETADLSGIKGLDIASEQGIEVSGQLITEEETLAAYNAAVSSLNGTESAYLLPLCLALGAVILSAVMIKLMKKKS